MQLALSNYLLPLKEMARGKELLSQLAIFGQHATWHPTLGMYATRIGRLEQSWKPAGHSFLTHFAAIECICNTENGQGIESN